MRTRETFPRTNTEQPVPVLYSELVNPIWLRIATDCGDIVYRQCHFYILAAQSNQCDLWSVSNYRLKRSSSFNNAMAIEEVTAPPQLPMDLSDTDTTVSRGDSKNEEENQ